VPYSVRITICDPQNKTSNVKTIRQILALNSLKEDTISLDKIRIDRTVVKSNITPPSDSLLLNDSVRILSRLMAKRQDSTGLIIHFTDKRKASKSLAFRIFNAKKAQNELLYTKLFTLTRVVLRQVTLVLTKVEKVCECSDKKMKWQAGV
jgi:IS5 family transposase